MVFVYLSDFFFTIAAALLADDEVLATQKNYRQKKNLLLNRKLLNELWDGKLEWIRSYKLNGELVSFEDGKIRRIFEFLRSKFFQRGAEVQLDV